MTKSLHAIQTFLLIFVSCVTFNAQQLPKAIVPVYKKDTFNIQKYIAKGDGLKLNTRIINQAIDACSKKGGGVVVVPAGMWLTGPVVLKSNVNLHLQRSPVLQF